MFWGPRTIQQFLVVRGDDGLLREDLLLAGDAIPEHMVRSSGPRVLVFAIVADVMGSRIQVLLKVEGPTPSQIGLKSAGPIVGVDHIEIQSEIDDVLIVGHRGLAFLDSEILGGLFLELGQLLRILVLLLKGQARGAGGQLLRVQSRVGGHGGVEARLRVANAVRYGAVQVLLKLRVDKLFQIHVFFSLLITIGNYCLISGCYARRSESFWKHLGRVPAEIRLQRGYFWQIEPTLVH